MDIDSKDWVEIFSSPDPAQIAALRSAFTSEKIEFIIRGDLTMAMRGCVTPARILVPKLHHPRASALLKHLTAAMSS